MNGAADMATIISTERGEVTLKPHEVAIRFDDEREQWVAIRGDGEQRWLHPSIDWYCDGNAIDAAAKAFGIPASEVLVNIVCF